MNQMQTKMRYMIKNYANALKHVTDHMVRCSSLINKKLKKEKNNFKKRKKTATQPGARTREYGYLRFKAERSTTALY